MCEGMNEYYLFDFFTDLTTVNHKMCYLFHLCLTTDAGDKYSKIFSGYTQSKSLGTCKC